MFVKNHFIKSAYTFLSSVFLSAILLFSFSLPSLAADAIKVENASVPSNWTMGVGDYWSQSFTVSGFTSITKVSGYMVISSASMTVKIFTGAGDGGSVLYNNTFTGKTCSGWCEFTPASPVTVSDGVYTVYFKINSSGGTPRLYFNSSNPYAGGALYIWGGLYAAYDSGFRIYGPDQTCGNSIVEGTETCDSSSISCTDAYGYAGNQTCNLTCTGYGSCLASTTAIVHTRLLNTDIAPVINQYLNPFLPTISMITSYFLMLSLFSLILFLIYYLIKHKYNVNKVQVTNFSDLRLLEYTRQDRRSQKTITHHHIIDARFWDQMKIYLRRQVDRIESRRVRPNVIEGEIVKRPLRIIGTRNIKHNHFNRKV